MGVLKILPLVDPIALISTTPHLGSAIFFLVSSFSSPVTFICANSWKALFLFFYFPSERLNFYLTAMLKVDFRAPSKESLDVKDGLFRADEGFK